MSTYNLNIDTVNTSLDFYEAEKHIYGSSRLGMLKDSVNVLGSAYGNTDSLNVTHKLGNKRYELSNHLGNVLTVISDKPMPHNNGGTVDYWEANISSAYDYSPFGVMLTGRTFEGKQTVCHDSTVQATQNALEAGFGSWGSWTADGNGAITYVADEMQISNPSSSKKNIGAHKDFNTGTGLHSVSFKVMGNVCANVVFWPPSSTPIPIKVSVKDNLGNSVATGNYTTAGTYSLSFTPASAGLTYRIEFYMANASAFCFFRVDNVLISYDDATTLTVCKEVSDGYRYGFQNQEVDNEISGQGNSYDFGARMYNPRVGRFLSIDPKAYNFSGQSPYIISSNSPIQAIDINGEYSVIAHYRMTKKILIKAGLSKKTAKEIAHYASTYADHPSNAVLAINKGLAIIQGVNPKELSYKADVDYSQTQESQNSSLISMVSIHAMKAMFEGISDEESEQRALYGGKFEQINEDGSTSIVEIEGAVNVIERLKNGKIEDLTENGKKELGVALHTIQDASAHHGKRWVDKEHKKEAKDKYGHKNEHPNGRCFGGIGKRKAKEETEKVINQFESNE